MDKFDVHSLGMILQSLIESFFIKEGAKLEVIEFLKKVMQRMVCKYSERMSIEEVIGVVEWLLYARNKFGIFLFKGTALETVKMWECQREEEVLEKQRKIVLAGIGHARRFSMQEWMEIHFILTFSLKKKQQIDQMLDKLLDRCLPEGELAKQDEYSDKEFNDIIFSMRNLHRVPLEKLEIKGVLGMGCNAIVWLVAANLQGIIRKFALKMLFNYYGSAISKIQNIEREFETLSRFQTMHKNIVQILRTFTAEPTAEMMQLIALHHDPEVIEYITEVNPITKHRKAAVTQFFLIEYHPLSLHEKLLAGHLSVEEIHKYSGDLLSASLFLYNNHVVHRDLKLENILVSHGDYLVVSDFGESLHSDHNHCVLLDNISSGNLQHTAPEVAMQIGTKSKVVDFTGQYSWETGCVIFQIIEGKFPFPFPVPKGAEPFKFSHLASKVNVKLLELVKKMLKFNPEERISIQQAYSEFKNIPI